MAQFELWGFARDGGEYGYGSIFRYHSPTDSVYKVYDFHGNPGGFPYLTHVTEGQNGKLYGTTESGGRHGNGVFFSFDMNSKEYRVIKHFTYNDSIGAMGCGGLYTHPSGKIWMITANGGIPGGGTFFEYDPSVDKVKYKKSMSEFYGNFSMSTFMKASNGKFYATTSEYQNYAIGFLFEYDEGLDSIRPIVKFDSVPGNRLFGHVVEGPSGKLYGTTQWGGNFQEGVIYEYDLNTNQYSVIKHLNEDIDGGEPQGSLVYYNGLLYGTTPQGGQHGRGTLFTIDPISRQFTIKKHFENGSRVISPQGALKIHPNGRLFGMSYGGGALNSGTIFSYDPILDTISIEHNFYQNYDGSHPYGSLFLASDGKFYGMTSEGGKGSGTLNSFDPVSRQSTLEVIFNSCLEGGTPRQLIKHSNGSFYGIVYRGGQFGVGGVFKYDPDIQVYEMIFHNQEWGSGPTYLNEGPGGRLFWFFLNHIPPSLPFYSLCSMDEYGQDIQVHYNLDRYLESANPNLQFDVIGYNQILCSSRRGDSTEQANIFNLNINDSSFSKLQSISNRKDFQIFENGIGIYHGICSDLNYPNSNHNLFEYNFITNSLTHFPSFSDSVEEINSYPIQIANDIWFSGAVDDQNWDGSSFLVKYSLSNNTYQFPYQQNKRIWGNIGTLYPGPNGTIFGLTSASWDGPESLFVYDTLARTFQKKFFFDGQFGNNLGPLIKTPVLMTRVKGDLSFSKTIKSYPNPFKNYFKIESQSTGVLKIFDLKGQEVFYTDYEPGQEINFEGPSGVYLLLFESQGEIKTQKLIKE